MFLSGHQLRCLEKLARARGEIEACHNCGKQRVGVDEADSGWSYRGQFRVALTCHNCGVGAGDFFITAEDARGCDIEPDENPPISETGG